MARNVMELPEAERAMNAMLEALVREAFAKALARRGVAPNLADELRREARLIREQNANG